MDNSYIIKAGINGLTATAGLYALGVRPADSASLNFFGLNQRIPLLSVGTIAGAVGSILNDSVHKMIHPNIHGKYKLQEAESFLSSAIISSATLNGLMYLINPATIQGIGALKITGVAIASEITGSYIDSIIESN
jgi:hypothetical protein